jgi:hypothetical protein
MKLLNCRECDDVVKLVDKVRSCECGRCTGVLDTNEITIVVTGPARVFEIPWFEYDQADVPRDRRGWIVVPVVVAR